MNKIKLIIFDLSGVCFSIEEPPYLELFIKKYRLESPKENFFGHYFEMLKKAERGEMSGIEIWNTLLKEFKIKSVPSLVIKEMMDLKSAELENLDVAKKLKEKGYIVVYLTNYNKDYWIEILRRFDFNKWFSWGVVSYEIGFRKPEKEGFQFILKKAEVEAEEAIFIDDFEANLKTPEELGINIIKYKDKEHLISGLRSLGVKY